MAYKCPRCGKPISRGGGSGTTAMMTGMVGVLFTTAFGRFVCEDCGKIPFGEFPPEVRARMIMGSVAMIVVAIVIFVICIALLSGSYT